MQEQHSRSSYLRKCHNTEVLFGVINSAIIPLWNRSRPGETCWFFYPSLKVQGRRIPNLLLVSCCFFNCLDPVLLSWFKEVLVVWSASPVPKKVAPAELFQEVFDKVNPSVLSVVNSSLATSIYPVSSKQSFSSVFRRIQPWSFNPQ